MDHVGLASDDDLVIAATGGDIDAFAQLVRRHQQVARRLAVGLVGFAEADDIAQEAFVRAHRSLASFRSGSEFRPWLLRIVANQAKNQRRSSQRRESRNALFVRRSHETSVGPAEAAEISDDRRRLVDSLTRLPERDRRVIALRYLLDCSERETADILGWRVGTVKSRTSRALDKLRIHIVDATEADQR